MRDAVQIIRVPAPHVHTWSSWRVEPDSSPQEPRFRTCYGCGVREQEHDPQEDA
jgi:hypothetical protein